MPRTAPGVRHLTVVLAALAAAALVTSCGEEQASPTTAVSATGGSQDVVETPASSTPTTTSTGAPDSSSGSEGAPETQPPTSVGAIPSAEQLIRQALDGGPWSGSVTGVTVAPGEELIVSISTGDESLPALEVCEAARGALTDVDGGATATINVWFTPDLAADGGDERVLATSLGGVECELVRSPE